jgi:hypothetical protein
VGAARSVAAKGGNRGEQLATVSDRAHAKPDKIIGGQFV